MQPLCKGLALNGGFERQTLTAIVVFYDKEAPYEATCKKKNIGSEIVLSVQLTLSMWIAYRFKIG